MPATLNCTPDVPEELVLGKATCVALPVLPSGPFAAPDVTVGVVPEVVHPLPVDICE